MRVGAASDPADVLVTAWLSPDGDALTAVLVNPEPSDIVVERAPGEERPIDSHVTGTVLSGIERSAELGELSPEGSVTLPGASIVTVAVGQQAHHAQRLPAGRD